MPQPESLCVRCGTPLRGRPNGHHGYPSSALPAGLIPAQRTDSTPPRPDPIPYLTLTADEMARYGQVVMGIVVQHLTDVEHLPASASRSAQQMRAILGDDGLPWEPTRFDVVLRQVVDGILTGNTLPHHPRNFAFVPIPSNFISILADLLATGFNMWPATWLSASAASAVEQQTIGWMREICGLPPGAGGLFVSGGSTANLTALTVARKVKLGGRPVPEAVAYVSSETHSSVGRAMMVLGFGPEQLRQVPVDDELRMDVTALHDMILRDRATGRRPWCVIGTAGTTGTGAIDLLTELAEVCVAEDVWFHVDAAIGGPARLSADRHLVIGLGEADSVTVDPHKTLMQPTEMGCVLVRDRRQLRDTFAVHPEYLQDTAGQDDEPNFADYGIQLARRSQAFKLWLSMKTFGAAAFGRAIDHPFGLARAAELYLREGSCWEVTSPAQLGIITFRYVACRPEHLDEVQSQIAAAIRESGYAMVCTTRVRGDVVLRLAMNNPRTTHEHVLETITRLAEHGAAVVKWLEDPS